MSLRVHITHRPDKDAQAALFAALAPEVSVTWGDQAPGHGFDILVCGRPSRELLAAGGDLRALVIPWAGVAPATAALMAEFPQVAVHNLHHNAAATAEMAVALMLAAAKSLVLVDGQLRQGDWSARGRMDAAVQLEGRVALVLGNGEIGRRVCRACKGLGMHVLAVSRSGLGAHSGDSLHAVSSLAELLPGADLLLVCLPGTPQTEGLLGAAQLALLPGSCVLVNVARGAVIEERALFEALRDGRLRAAGLDVWWRYPQDDQPTMPSEYPFHELCNVVLSPHRGGHVRETEALRMRALASLLNHAAAGREMPQRVELQRGY
ncbi:MAG: hydroxyacid dehydrogenase [Planctomycetes bacterium]|nr:hydroxyacid dehydrogenase [Planctomycetota bacterium]